MDNIMNQKKYKVSLDKLVKSLKLDPIYLPKDLSELYVTSPEVNRPGLQLSGFYEGFQPERMQIFGNSEMDYLQTFIPEQQHNTMELFLSHDIPALVFCNGAAEPEYIIELAKKYERPVFRCAQTPCGLMSSIMSILNVELAPRITRHGVLMEVYGEGVMIMGESGVGKSETAIELLKRGHRLVADDAVEIRRVSDRTLVGQSPENIRHFMELRGVGIVNTRHLFGISSVKSSEKLDMVIRLENWDPSKVYDRMGLDEETIEILGLNIPCLTVPVTSGRNLAVIIEVAVMNNRAKKLGYNAAKDLLANLGMAE